ncbi:TetR/AcrR family transcriptional regulator [Actinomadura rugatobispora]|uniref:TetR/AcrR family transcriptional regulator n=1 Tax=Actinomadura rugatobispora TaxID=1994 RepID=A0ABW0ZWV6_9ACTN|nr:hypothetical protein GCM10010200_111320 [Actinomadura rugatobispora]
MARGSDSRRAQTGTEAERRATPSFDRDRHERILDAGLALLQEQPDESVRVDDIARAAGMAKATIYRYFPSREHLYVAIYRQWTEREQRRRRRPAPTSGADRARLRGHALLDAFQRHPRFFELNVMLSASTDPDVQAELSALTARTRRYFANDFAILGVAAPHDAAVMLSAILHSALTAAVYHGTPFTETHRLLDRFVDLYDPPEGGDPVGASETRAHPAPPSKERSNDRSERRDRIVAAAHTALRERPYERIHVADVAQRAQVALGTFYREFSSKEHLYAVVIREWAGAGPFRSSLDAEAPEARLRTRIRALLDTFEEDPQFFKVNVLLYSAADDAVGSIMAGIHAESHQILVADFRALGASVPEDAAVMLWSILSTLTTAALTYDGSFPEARRVADEFITLIARSTARRASHLA